MNNMKKLLITISVIGLLSSCGTDKQLLTEKEMTDFTVKGDTILIKEVGPNIQGMIRYTFFEDFSLPPINWEVTQKELLETYQPKVMKDITEGKIKPGKHEFGETDWVEVIK